MNDEKIDPEIEQLLKNVRSKKPPRELMANFASGVNSRIDERIKRPPFAMPALGVLALAAVLVIGALYYFYKQPAPKSQSIEPLSSVQLQETGRNMESAGKASILPAKSQELSFEEVAKLLEALEETEIDEEEAAALDLVLLEVDDAAEELALLDEFEIGPPITGKV